MCRPADLRELSSRFYGGGIQVAVGDLGDLSHGNMADVLIDHNWVWQSYGNGLEFWNQLADKGRSNACLRKPNHVVGPPGDGRVQLV